MVRLGDQMTPSFFPVFPMISITRSRTSSVWVAMKLVRRSARSGGTAGGMIGSDVEGFEIQPLRLHLGTLCDLVAHPDEDVLDPLGQRRDRVPGALRTPAARKSDVNPLLADHPLVTFPCQMRVRALVRLLHVAQRRVDPLPLSAAGGGRQGADLPAGEQDR